MYLGFFAGWAGLWVVFGLADRALIVAAMAVVLGVALFVRLYEEPTLRKMFGRIRGILAKRDSVGAASAGGAGQKCLTRDLRPVDEEECHSDSESGAS
jgi:hypothetical protein